MVTFVYHLVVFVYHALTFVYNLHITRMPLADLSCRSAKQTKKPPYKGGRVMRECVMDMRGRGHAGGENAGVWQAGQRQTRIAPPPDRIHSPSRYPLRGRVLGSASAASRLVSRQAHASVPIPPCSIIHLVESSETKTLPFCISFSRFAE